MSNEESNDIKTHPNETTDLISYFTIGILFLINLLNYMDRLIIAGNIKLNKKLKKIIMI